MDSQTIVAPMTPAGVSAVAAIRVSGSRVREVVRLLFGEAALKNLKAREAKLATARDYRTMAGDDRATAQVVDSLLYIFFEGPNSYTGEDVLELYPHGNPLIVRDLLQAIRSIEGVRLAEPGEYTRRAFLNGKKKPGEKFMKVFHVICALVVLVGAVIPMAACWDLADITMAGMTLINLPACVILGKVAINALKDYECQRKVRANPQFSAKNVGLENENLDYWKA